ncbi:hypothetical protein K1719_013779 [Acacia pycnantha]|nr:hypothetical protein K1719_013779 [Acacia pycnantha]
MLISINCIIDDAEYKQFSDSNVKAWLCELKDVVYNAEDVLDEINYELYKDSSVIAEVQKFFDSSVSSFDEDIESRLKQIFESLEFLESRKIALGLKEGKGGVVGSATKLPITSLVDEDGTYGRNEDKEIIIKWLLNDSHSFVMSIVGMGGLAKPPLHSLFTMMTRFRVNLTKEFGYVFLMTLMF